MNFIDKLNEELKIESDREYNLGNLIDDLEEYKDKYLEVEFDNGTIPTEFDSWRGSYNELALNYSKEGVIHSDELYRLAYNADGATYYGYKGGDFTMDRQTPIHQANSGDVGAVEDNGNYNIRKIIGIQKVEDKLIILTRIEED